jgi:hypothetical protein
VFGSPKFTVNRTAIGFLPGDDPEVLSHLVASLPSSFSGISPLSLFFSTSGSGGDLRVVVAAAVVCWWLWWWQRRWPDGGRSGGVRRYAEKWWRQQGQRRLLDFFFAFVCLVILKTHNKGV